MPNTRHRLLSALFLLTPALAIVAAAGGCWRSSGPEVVVYAALDSEFSEPILKDFERETGIRVLTKFDAESTKTVGLTNDILTERARPRCDLFWNNEILNTLRLEREGLLDVYLSPAAADFPPSCRSADGYWHGLAARVRVLIVNTDLVPPEDRPDSILDLTDPKWRGKVAIAKPLFGTTATHAACLFAAWGDDRAKQFFRDVNRNAKVLSGNKQVALAVSRGDLAFGLTDTDDAIIELDQRHPVAIVFPDQEPGGLGALVIPNTLAIIQGAPNTEHARRLVDYLLRPEVESRLAEGRSAQFPLNAKVETRSRAEPPEPIRQMQVDFSAAADKWDAAAEFLRDEFATPRSRP